MDRRKQIYHYILQNSDVTINNVMSHFNISLRTLRYDLQEINEAPYSEFYFKTAKNKIIFTKNKTKLIKQQDLIVLLATTEITNLTLFASKNFYTLRQLKSEIKRLISNYHFLHSFERIDNI